MNKGDLEKLSEIINNYSSNEKYKRDLSENQLKELRKKNMGLLCLGLLELSTLPNYSEISKITCLVLLRKIIEIDSKNYWGNINQKIKDEIKRKSIYSLLNFSNNSSYEIINKMAFIIKQLVNCIEDFDELWPELLDLTNNLLKLSFPQDIIKIYAIIKTIKYCLSFLSNEILLHLFQYNQFFQNIYEANVQNDIKILELKVISCDFYSELTKYSIHNNLCDISSSSNYISSNMIKTLKECLIYLNENNNDTNVEYLISDVLISTEILTLPEIYSTFPSEYKELNILLSSIIKLPCYKYQKIIEQSFQRMLEIYLIDIYSFEEKETVIKNFLDELFKYAYNNINLSNFNENNDFSLILDNYNDYEQAPKIYYDVLNFVFDITSQMIQDNEKYIDMFQELENNLLNNQNSIYKYIAFLFLSQIIESINEFNKIEMYIKICFDNLSDNNFQIRYAASYSINSYIVYFGNSFSSKYYLQFLEIIMQKIKNERNFHTKCEIISTFNSFINHIDEETENNVKEYLFKNANIILKFLLEEFDNDIKNENDCSNNLIKNEILKSMIICTQLFSDECKSYAIDIASYLTKFLENIYNKKLKINLYINLLYAISSFGKFDNNNVIIYNIELIHNCIEEILKNIKDYLNQISRINPIIINILPIINSNKPEFTSKIINNLIDILLSFINEINENDTNHTEDIYNFFIIINTSVEIIHDKCLNYLPQIENCIEKMLNKIKTISKINNVISDILSKIIQILSKLDNNKNLKKKGKNYLEILFNIIKHEYNSSTTLSIVNNLNKIFENIVTFLNQNELEQVFNGIIQLIEFFESKISALLYKKNKTENEIEMETEDLSISSEDYEENSEKEVIEMLEENIENLEQVNENLSLVIENMMKYCSKKKIKNISECLYNKIIPSLINSNNNYNNSNNIKIAVNLIDDLIEYLDFNKFSAHILDDLINLLIKYSKYIKPDVRQAANYGLGIFIKISDINIYKKYYIDILKSLKLSCINFPSNNSMDRKLYRANGLAYENAIASIGKSIGYKKMEELEYINLWIDNLPLKVDETEMEEGHDILCDFIINKIYKNVNLGEKYLEKIIKALVNIYGESNLSNNEINGKIKTIFHNIELRQIIEKIYNDNNKENNQYKTKIEILIN